MVDLDNLPEDLRALLDRFGFDRRRFEEQRRAVAEGRLSPASNIVRGALRPPGPGAWRELPPRGKPEAEEFARAGRAAIAAGRVGVVILNGGMATRFGGVVKGVVEALPGRSFLELKIASVKRAAESCGGRVPVFLMNSFATDEATRRHVRDKEFFGLDEGDLGFFHQGISLRLTTGGDLFLDDQGRPSCYGPGHGDCPVFLRRSGLLADFLAAGGRYLFISNVDNLAARLDPLVLGMHIESGQPLTAEVAPKRPGDKGGAPVFVDDRLWIVEGFRFPADFDQDSVPVFNTNTFTADAGALDREFDLTPCYVRKQIGGRTAVQIETLIGELTRFLPTQYLRVERSGAESRFFPIKTPEDLARGRDELAAICDVPPV